MCRPCQKVVVWGSHHHHALSAKHVTLLGKYQESKRAEQLLLTEHHAWQEANHLQGSQLSSHVQKFRLDMLKACCMGNISIGAVPSLESMLLQHTGKTLGGTRGVLDNVPFLW